MNFKNFLEDIEGLSKPKLAGSEYFGKKQGSAHVNPMKKLAAWSHPQAVMPAKLAYDGLNSVEVFAKPKSPQWLISKPSQSL